MDQFSENGSTKYLSKDSKNNRPNKLDSETFHFGVKIGNENERHQYLYDFFKSSKNVVEKSKKNH